MSAYKSPKTEQEFIERTRKIIDQYNNLESSLGEDFYDVTLLLNTLLGLVVLPRENKLNELTDKNIPISIASTLISATNENNEHIDVKFKEYVVGLRNAIVHFGQNNSLRFSNDAEGGKIEAISIEGTTNNKNHTLKFYFDLKDGNQLREVIDEILTFVNI